jgi:hypothetical protein
LRAVRRGGRTIALAAGVAAALCAFPAAAATTRSCKSSDLRFAYRAGQPKYFGVFHLRERGTTCGVARTLARDAGRKILPTGKVPARVDGFRLTQFQPPQAQTFGVRGRKGSAVVTFWYVVPNG